MCLKDKRLWQLPQNMLAVLAGRCCRCDVGVRDYGNKHHVFVCLCDETSEGVRKTIEGGYTGVGAGCL